MNDIWDELRVGQVITDRDGAFNVFRLYAGAAVLTSVNNNVVRVIWKGLSGCQTPN